MNTDFLRLMGKTGDKTIIKRLKCKANLEKIISVRILTGWPPAAVIGHKENHDETCKKCPVRTWTKWYCDIPWIKRNDIK